MAENPIIRQQLTIRVGRNTLSFSQPTADGKDVIFEPYVVKSGISIAANLREAFKTADLLAEVPPRARVLIDTDVLMVPIETFSEKTMESMMHHAFPNSESDVCMHNVLPDLNAVAVFAVNRDLNLVLDDHFRHVTYIAAMAPVWRHLHQRSYTGNRHKLYGYFHEQRLDVFSFHQNRFKFCNSFDANHAHDSLYFLLYVWKQLQLQATHDELHIVGDIPEQEWLINELSRYVQNAYIINPTVDFSHAPVTSIKGMTFDLQTLFVKGR